MVTQTAQSRTEPEALVSGETALVRLLTADDFRGMPETNKICELIHGEIVWAPSAQPMHQWVVARLARKLDDHLDGKHLGVVFIAPFDVYLSTFEVYQPDIVVLLRETVSRLSVRGLSGPPDIAVEVLSPSNRKQDLVTKAAEYARAGVSEYWVVDPDADRIEVYRLEEGVYRLVPSGDGVARSVLLPGLEVAPAAIFTQPAWVTAPADATSGSGEEP